MSTQWNWSWVAAPDDTLKASDSFDQSGGTLYTYRAANRGQLDASDISTSIDSISTNINQQWRLWRIYIRPLLDSLPAGARDQRWRPGTGLPPKIDALTYGIQGTTLFVFNDATSTNGYGKYWDTDDERPKTIAEAMEDIWESIAQITADTATASLFDDSSLWYAIGDRYDDGTVSSAATSLDARVTTLEGAITHNTLDECYDQGGPGLGREITVDAGSVLMVSTNNSNNTCLQVTQNDVTNNPIGFILMNSGTGSGISMQGGGSRSINSPNGDMTISTTVTGNIIIDTNDDEMTLINTDAVVDSDKAFYLGDSSTNGSWRVIRSGNNLLMERRESAAWVTKQTITP